ncbi:UNVERIFIED_CONTAM: hypothetical protein Slati_1617000 [Sesamum latifolium]|uniref:CLAVATA3/ESR (CLE)-related protein 25 n=1 Tax=Sesamum latifolium TaxID=2727402 RepID=A0AAW2XAC5_9LAMI
MGSRKRVVGGALSVSLLWFLLVLSLADWRNGRDAATTTVPSTASLKFLKPIETGKSGVRDRNFNLNCVSKRRVPNGPDPIHNRNMSSCSSDDVFTTQICLDSFCSPGE